MDRVADRRRYEAPALNVIGTFEQVTQATASGTRLDQTFPTGTPVPLPPDSLS